MLRRRIGGPRRATALALGLGLLAGIAAGSDAPDVRLSDGLLEGRVRDATVEHVVSEIAAQAGARVEGGLAAPDRTVSADFARTPLAEGLERVLRGQSFSLVYSAAGDLRTIRLHGAGGAPRAAKAPSPRGLPSSPAAGATELLRAVAAAPPIPVEPALAEVMGAGEVSIASLYDVAMRNSSPDVRRQALQALVRAFERNPQLRSAALGTEKAAITGLLGAGVGPGAADVAQALGRLGATDGGHQADAN